MLMSCGIKLWPVPRNRQVCELRVATELPQVATGDGPLGSRGRGPSRWQPAWGLLLHAAKRVCLTRLGRAHHNARAAA